MSKPATTASTTKANHRSMRPTALLLGSALLLSSVSNSNVLVEGFSTTKTTTPKSRTKSIQLQPLRPNQASFSSSSPSVSSFVSLEALPSSSNLPNNGADTNNPMDSTTALSYTNAEYMPRGVVTSGNDKTEQTTARVNHQWTKQNLAIAMPALMGLLADPVLSMVDTGFVGRSGPINLAALGVCTSIFHMAFTVFRASTVATTSLVGSAENDEQRRQITKLSLQFAGVLGTLVLAALRFGGPKMLATMGVPSSSPLYKPACDYLFARCWAAPAVVGLVVAEGAFRGNDDSKTPLVASAVAAVINLILDPILMFPLGMGMAGAAVATALSQFGAAGVYGWRLFKRRLLPQPTDTTQINKAKVIKSIIGANLAMLAKQGSMLVFYTAATALATRMGPVHVATHQVALSLFWLVTMWLDSGSISGQVLMSKNMSVPAKARSLTKYMAKYALLQGLAFSALVAGIGKFVPGVFTSDVTIQALLLKCLPHLAIQQTIVSLVLILEGIAIGGNQFRYMAAGTAASTAVGVWQLTRATSVVGIWGSAVNTFFALRLVNAIIGVTRVHLGLNRKEKMEAAAAAQTNDRQNDNTVDGMIPSPSS